jgi:hypothetical protein
MCAKVCALVLISIPTLPLLSQAACSQDRVTQHSRHAHPYLVQHRPDLATPETIALVALDPENLDAQANLAAQDGDTSQQEAMERVFAKTLDDPEKQIDKLLSRPPRAAIFSA